MSTTPKIVFVGNSGSGKTKVVQMLRYGELPDANNFTHIPTMGVEVHPIRLATGGKIHKVWDCAGNPKFIGLDGGYYQCAETVYIFDGGEEYMKPEEWEAHVKKYVPNVKIVHVVGSVDEKCERMRRELSQ